QVGAGSLPGSVPELRRGLPEVAQREPPLSFCWGFAARRTLVAAALLIIAPSARAQTRPPTNSRVFEFRVAPVAPRVGQGEIPPLPPPVQATLERAQQLAADGRLEAAKDSLTAALTRVPHHPALLLELSTVLQARGSWRQIEQLARAERTAA